MPCSSSTRHYLFGVIMEYVCLVVAIALFVKSFFEFKEFKKLVITDHNIFQDDIFIKDIYSNLKDAKSKTIIFDLVIGLILLVGGILGLVL